MRTLRSVVVGVVIVAVLGLVAAGCGSKNEGGGAAAPHLASPSPSPVDPKAALLASFAAVARNSASITVKQGPTNATAKVDPAGKKAEVTAIAVTEGSRLKRDVIFIDPDAWVKTDLGPELNAQLKLDPTKWTKVDPAKLDDDALPIGVKGDSDVLDLPQLFTGLGNVTQMDAAHFSGTLDLTKATGHSALPSHDLKELGSMASVAPFTAVVDHQGRLTNLTIQTGDPDSAMEITITGYGAPQVINPPPASGVVPAPPGAYYMPNPRVGNR